MTGPTSRPGESQPTVIEGRMIDTDRFRPGPVDLPLDPCTIVIFGASGDLTQRKLMPALYNLFVNGGLPDPFLIVGCARSELSDRAFHERSRNGLASRGGSDLSQWERFAERLYYRPVIYDSPASLGELADFLRRLDRIHGTRGNRIFYMATPPAVHELVGAHLGRTGLTKEGPDGDGWSRIVVEKPFGFDLESAVALNRALATSFQEKQIFRIDHYVAKETVQNLLMFRFANAIFEPIWNRRYVDHVSITASETVGVEHRAGYYERSGVIRDMFQNHMLQLLAMSAMEPPTCFEEDRVREEKIKVYHSLRPFPVDRLNDYLVLGQYGPGLMDGRPVPGYREEPGVDPNSNTPTFAMLKVFIENWRWQGVPFYLTSGKRLPKKATRIVIKFKPVPHSMFRQGRPEDIQVNYLVLGIQPEETITLTFQTKHPGAKVRLRTVRMEFDYLKDYAGPVLDAYEKALLDCMLGDHMLFWRQDGVELSWSYLTPIIKACETCRDPGGLLHFYQAGQWGPSEAVNLHPDTSAWIV